MNKKSLTGIIATALVSTCLYVMPAFAAPQVGVYQQMYADGRLKSTVTVLKNPGTGDLMAMNGMGDSTYICMDALDKDGIEVEEYAVKYNPEAEPAYGFTINASNLRKCEEADWFNVEANKKHANFNFIDDEKVIVSGAGSLYDGVYHFSPRSNAEANYALLAYAYEATKKPNLAYDGQGVAASYNIFQFVKYPTLVNLQIKNSGEQEKNVLLDKGFNIAMEYSQQGNAIYKPFFMSDNYVEWAGSNLSGLQQWVNDDLGALYMHQYIARNYPSLAKANNIKLRAVDFYGGEGENAVFTRVYDVLKNVDGDEMLSARASHSDNGRMNVIQYIGNKSVTGDEVRLRQFPNTNCKILGYVNRGDVVKVLGLTENREWAAVEIPNSPIGFQIGYISTQFVAGVRD